MGLASCIITNGGQFTQAGGGILRGDVTLRCAEHLITDHMFFDGRATEQGRVKMGVQMPMGLAATVHRRLMKAHAIGKDGLKKVIVANG